jgi:hypothetical protein
MRLPSRISLFRRRAGRPPGWLRRRTDACLAAYRDRRWQRWQDEAAPLLAIADDCRVCDRPLRLTRARGRLRELRVDMAGTMCDRCRRLAGPPRERLIAASDLPDGGR